MNQNADYLEESLLTAIDAAIEQEISQGAKALMELFKTTVLKKYKVAYDHELSQGRVHQKNLDKAIDFLFNDACASFRLLPELTDGQKDREIQIAKQQLATIKRIARDFLANKGIVIIP